jgi:hypothetical protein
VILAPANYHRDIDESREGMVLRVVVKNRSSTLRWSFNFNLTDPTADQDTIRLQPMEFQFQPNGNEQAPKIPSGFSRWSFNFNLTDPTADQDTIRLQPMEFQFQPTERTSAKDTIGL